MRNARGVMKINKIHRDFIDELANSILDQLLKKYVIKALPGESSNKFMDLKISIKAGLNEHELKIESPAEHLCSFDLQELKKEDLQAILDFEKVVEEFTAIPMSIIKGKRRYEELVDIRFRIQHYLYCNAEWTLKKIGTYFNRDHSSIHHGIAVVNEQCEFSRTYKGKTIKLKNYLSAAERINE